MVWLLWSLAFAGALEERDIGIAVGLTPRYQGFPLGFDHAALRWQASPKWVLSPTLRGQYGGWSNVVDGDHRTTGLAIGLDARWYAAQRGDVSLVATAGLEGGRNTLRNASAPRSGTVSLFADLHTAIGVEWAPNSTWSVALDLEAPVIGAGTYYFDGEDGDLNLGTNWQIGPSRVTPVLSGTWWF